MIIVQSVQVGKITTEGSGDAGDITSRHWTTGFYKRPTSKVVKVTTEGIVGDQVADRKNHGGPDKAVLCYCAEHYSKWAARYPQMDGQFGGFGENLTLRGADEQTVCLGDRFRIGSCLLEVSQPRQPCWKISRRWRIKSLLKEVVRSGRTGWYCRVIEEGELCSGDRVLRIERPFPESSKSWTVARANALMFGHEVDRAAVAELIHLPTLAIAWKQDMA